MRDCSLKPLALFVVLVATASALVMIAPASDAETYDGTIDLYGYKITMGLIEPNQVSSVEWDFGDGSEKVTVQIEILSNGLTAPPSAEGIEAVVKG